MKEYLKDMQPAEVIDRLHEGQIVYYIDTRGKRFQYQMHRGVLWRYNRDTHEVDGYNRSIYSTGECYFETEEEIRIKPGKRYRTRDGRIAITTSETDGSWIKGFIVEKSSEVRVASWKDDGLFYGEGTRDQRDIVEELD